MVVAAAALSGACARAPDAAVTEDDEDAASHLSSPIPQDEVDRLRSLPYLDFARDDANPSNSGVTLFDEARSQPGYNLYTIRRERAAEIVNAAGEPVHRWQYGDRGNWARSVLLESGDLLVVGADPQRFLMLLAWNGDVVWRRELASHHDVSLTPDGNLVLLALTRRDIRDIYPDHVVRDDLVVMLSAGGETLATKSLFDIVSTRPDLFELARIAPSNAGHIDLFHSNSVRWMNLPHLAGSDPLYGPNNVVVSIRHQDRVIIFDWQTSELLWAWGEGELSGPHDASILENGNLLIFDNGLARGWSRVIELDPRSKAIVWEYRAADLESFYTASRGGSQRLANGNTLITESGAGRAFEVTPDGDVVWEYWVPSDSNRRRRSTIIRLYRYDTALVERLLLAATESPGR